MRSQDHDELTAGTVVALPGLTITQFIEEGPHVGKGVARFFEGVGLCVGVITGYAAPGDSEDEVALWHVQYKDGDHEDINEAELDEAIQMYDSIYYESDSQASDVTQLYV